MPPGKPRAGRMARLQQGLMLFGLTMALVGGWLLADRPWLAAGWVCWWLAGWWMWVLAVQVVLSQLFNRAAWRVDPVRALRPESWWGAMRVLLWACWEAPKLFFWRQPWQEHRWLDQLPVPGSPSVDEDDAAMHASGVKSSPRAVLFVHGFVSNRGFWNPWLARLTREGAPFVAISLSKPFALLDEQALELSAQVDRIIQATGRPPLIVAHSMGGLVVRAWLRQEARQGRAWQAQVHQVVFLGVPLAGTGLAAWSGLPLGRQMRRAQDGGQWVTQLNADLKALGVTDAWFVCVASNADNMIFPAHSALLSAAAKQQVLRAVPHVPLAYRPEVMRAVLALR